MEKQEHSAITFVRNHEKDIIEREKYKYEPIKKKDSNDTIIKNKDNLKGENINLKNEEKIEYLYLKLEKREQKIVTLEKENKKLKSSNNEEWYNKYKKYIQKFKDTKKEFI